VRQLLHCALWRARRRHPTAKETDESYQKEIEELRLVPGVGEAKAEPPSRGGYRSVKDLQNAKADDLATVKGIGEKLAAKIIRGRGVS